MSEESPVWGIYEFAFHTLGTGLVRTLLEVIGEVLPGKVPPEILRKIVFTKLGAIDPDVLLGPRVGEDAAVIRVGDKMIVAATDPITGSISDVGWLAVHVNANDIATFGIRPRWFLASIILPKDSTPDQLQIIMKQIDEVCQNLGISVAGGHSEVTDGIDRPLIAGFMIGITDDGEYVTSSGAQPGDSIIVTKTIALEGTSILATEGEEYLAHKVPATTIEHAKRMRSQISVVAEGVAAFETGFVTAMHDPTEGGLSGGLHELCDASNVGFEIYSNAIPLDDSTYEICSVLEISPMELISSGCMIICCREENVNEVVNTIQSRGIMASVIGQIVKKPDRRIIVTETDGIPLERPITDELWNALKKLNPP
ncbi:MAG: AIR synthase family protein [Candidatus Thorarchaeota archaeon]